MSPRHVHSHGLCTAAQATELDSKCGWARGRTVVVEGTVMNGQWVERVRGKSVGHTHRRSCGVRRREVSARDVVVDAPMAMHPVPAVQDRA